MIYRIRAPVTLPSSLSRAHLDTHDSVLATYLMF